MEDGRPVVPSEGQQQMLPSQVPMRNEEPRTEADLLSVVGDEEEHHEKKPMMTRMKDKMRRMKDSMTKNKHGPVDHHDVHVDDDEHSVETEGDGERYDDPDEEMEMEFSTTPHGLGDQQEPPVTPETIKDTALDADPVDPLRNGYVSRTTGNEQRMFPDVVSSFQDMDISSDVEKKPSYAAGVKEGEEKPSYTEKHPATAVVAEDVRSVVGDEEEHHEKKPMMTRMKNRMRRMKDSMTKKMHGHVDDHDFHDDDEHSDEAEAEADGNDEHIDLGISSQGEHVPLSSWDDRPVMLPSRDQDVPVGGLGIRDELPVSLSDREQRATLGSLQEPPITPETIEDTALDVNPVDDGNISDPKTGNEQSVSPDVLSSFQYMDISSDVEKNPSNTEKLSTSAAGIKEGEEKPNYTEKLTAIHFFIFFGFVAGD